MLFQEGIFRVLATEEEMKTFRRVLIVYNGEKKDRKAVFDKES